MPDQQPTKIRLQPAELEIPKDDPFYGDKLHRKESIEALTTMLGNLDGPAVVAVDAGWGMGKTTFLRMWAQNLRNERIPVVEFNAWKTDFTWDPFLALWSEVAAQLGEQPESESYTLLSEVARKLSPLLRVGGITAGVASAALGQPELAMAATASSEVLNHLADASDSKAEDGEASGETPFLESTYKEAKALLENFQSTLQATALSLARQNQGRPLVVFVDELDRCRPTYTIELLETAKHLFGVDHIVFILCLDREQLAHSVKAVYGTEFAADGYLRRFFDLDVRLPNPPRKQFINDAIESSGLYHHLKGRSEYQRGNWFSDPEALEGILSLPVLSLRDALQVLHRLSVIVSSIPENQLVFAEALAVLLTLRTTNIELYRRVLSGSVTDHEAVSAILSGRAKEDQFIDRVRIAVEATIGASLCIATVGVEGRPDLEKVPMLQQHISVATSDATGSRGHDTEKEHAGLVLDAISHLFDPQSSRSRYSLGPIRSFDMEPLKVIRGRLELFPPDVAE